MWRIIFLFIIYFLTFLVKSLDFKVYSSINHSLYDSLINEYKKELNFKLKQRLSDYYIQLPEIVFDSAISFNAQYKDSIIFIGKGFFLKDYFTIEDRLSIVYHEYNHYLHDRKNLYPCRKDTNGNIFQIETKKIAYKPPSPLDSIDVIKLRESGISEIEIGYLKKEINGNLPERFIYAPSNLSKSEISCYEAELIGDEKMELFKLSNLYKSMVIYQIKVEMIYLKMREEFELENHLKPDGFALDK